MNTELIIDQTLQFFSLQSQMKSGHDKNARIKACTILKHTYNDCRLLLPKAHPKKNFGVLKISFNSLVLNCEQKPLDELDEETE